MRFPQIVLIGFFVKVSLLFPAIGWSALADPTIPLGETIKYDIKKLKVKVGEASLAFDKETHIDGKAVYLIVFTAQGLNFFDEEKIYIDKDTFLPLKVERDLNIFGKKEKIVEQYLQNEGKIKITKFVKNKKTEQTIEKKGSVDNIYAFLYRLRKQRQMKLKDEFNLNLPTVDVVIVTESKKELSVGKKNYSTYFMQSDPRKYKIWIADDKFLTPLRIDGAIGLGSTSMTITEYKE